MVEKKLIIGIKCSTCSTLTYPKRVCCPSCRGTKFEDWNLPNTGELYSFTKINFPLQNYNESSYIVGLVTFGNDFPRVTVRIDPLYIDKVKIGVKLKLSETNFPESNSLPILQAEPL